jgi:translation initiation factor IF-3
MMDFGKYKYQLKKKAAESKKKQVIITVKEIQFRPNTDVHDIDYKTRHILEFLAEGHKCRVIVTFRGREVAHSELGRALLSKIIATLGDKCVIEQPPIQEGKKLSMLVGPASGVKSASKAAKPKQNPVVKTDGAGLVKAPAASHGGAQSGNETKPAQVAAGDVKK